MERNDIYCEMDRAAVEMWPPECPLDGFRHFRPADTVTITCHNVPSLLAKRIVSVLTEWESGEMLDG